MNAILSSIISDRANRKPFKEPSACNEPQSMFLVSNPQGELTNTIHLQSDKSALPPGVYEESSALRSAVLDLLNEYFDTGAMAVHLGTVLEALENVAEKSIRIENVAGFSPNAALQMSPANQVVPPAAIAAV